jgi:hypothetical protein
MSGMYPRLTKKKKDRPTAGTVSGKLALSADACTCSGSGMAIIQLTKLTVTALHCTKNI